MAGDQTSETSSSVTINPALARSGQHALDGANALYGNQGVKGIYVGSRLGEQDPLVRQAQQQQLRQASGGIQGQVDAQQGAFTNLLQAGNLDGSSLFQDQVANALDQANVDFGRGSQGIFQQGTAAGQFGSSEVGESLGLFGGEVNRNMQNAITQAALGGQQVALGAQQLAPQSIGLGLLPSQIQQDVGNQRSALNQQLLNDRIQEFEAPRRARVQNQMEFQNFLASNPLMGESTTTNTQTTSGDPLQAILGAGATLGGAYLGGGGDFSGITSMFGGGGQSSGGLGNLSGATGGGGGFA